jgi:hypothetical protein
MFGGQLGYKTGTVKGPVACSDFCPADKGLSNKGCQLSRPNYLFLSCLSGIINNTYYRETIGTVQLLGR